jgi:hypothetical protein
MTQPNANILGIVKAMALYDYKGNYEVTSFNTFLQKVMFEYRIMARTITTDQYSEDIVRMYRFPMTWGQVANSMIRYPNPDLYAKIQNLLLCADMNSLLCDLPKAKEACDRFDRVTYAGAKALESFLH